MEVLRRRFRPASAGLVSLLLAASPSAQQPIITHFEPSQLRISVPAQTLTVHGDNLQTVQTCIGVLATANGAKEVREGRSG